MIGYHWTLMSSLRLMGTVKWLKFQSLTIQDYSRTIGKPLFVRLISDTSLLALKPMALFIFVFPSQRMALSMSFTLSTITEGSDMGFGWTSWERWGYFEISDVGFQCYQSAGGISYSLVGGGSWCPTRSIYLFQWLQWPGIWESACGLIFYQSANDTIAPGIWGSPGI